MRALLLASVLPWALVAPATGVPEGNAAATRNAASPEDGRESASELGPSAEDEALAPGLVARFGPRRILAASVSLLAGLGALFALRHGRRSMGASAPQEDSADEPAVLEDTLPEDAVPEDAVPEEDGTGSGATEEEEAGPLAEPVAPELEGWECEDDIFVQLDAPLGPDDLETETSTADPPELREAEEVPAPPQEPDEPPILGSEDTEKPMMEPAVAGAPASLCALLLAEGRLEEAEGLARSQLGDGPEMVAILRQVARVAELVGETEQALEFSLRAFQAGRGREDFAHLVRLIALERRFAPGDRHRLRSAVLEHPQEPVLLYAAGVWETMFGDPPRAQRLLRAALRHDPDEELRGAIARELDPLG